MSMEQQGDFTRQANDPAIKKAISTVRERYPASYFGHLDVDEVIGLAVWEARPIIQKRWSDELKRLQAVLEEIRSAVHASGDQALSDAVDALIDTPPA
jgi:hypothetical protein